MYDEAKRFAEAMTMAYRQMHGMDTRIVRIFNTYGPRMSLDDGRVVPNLLQQALRGESLTIYGDGNQTRSFCYVDDLVEGIYRLLLSGEHLPVNIGNPTETSILEFAKIINQLTGNKAGLEYQPDKRFGNDPQRRCPDITRARSLLGWDPKVDLVEGSDAHTGILQRKDEQSMTVSHYKSPGAHTFLEIHGRGRDWSSGGFWDHEPVFEIIWHAAGLGRDDFLYLCDHQQFHLEPLLDLSRFALAPHLRAIVHVFHCQCGRACHPSPDPAFP